jgi:hypothetical protein
MNGKPDLLKGSYYANVLSPHVSTPVPSSEAEQFKEYYSDNICQYACPFMFFAVYALDNRADFRKRGRRFASRL